MALNRAADPIKDCEYGHERLQRNHVVAGTVSQTCGFAQGGDNGNWFIGFNITRKFY